MRQGVFPPARMQLMVYSKNLATGGCLHRPDAIVCPEYLAKGGVSTRQDDLNSLHEKIVLRGAFSPAIN